MDMIVFRGLPGTGKSSLAEAVGTALHAPVFALDWLLGALKPFGILNSENAAPVGYGLIGMLAERQLRLGLPAIADSPAHTAELLYRWQALAAEHSATFWVIETICSDPALHRARLEGRTRGIPGWHEVTWAHVERMQAIFEPWPGDKLLVDAVDPLADNIRAVLNYIGH